MTASRLDSRPGRAGARKLTAPARGSPSTDIAHAASTPRGAARLAILLAILAAPVAAGIVLISVGRYRQTEAEVKSRLSSIVLAGNAQAGGVIERTREEVAELARSAAGLRADKPACQAELGRRLNTFFGAADIAIADGQGVILCSARAVGAAGQLAGQEFSYLARRTSSPVAVVAGNGALTGSPAIVVAQSAPGGAGLIVFAEIPLEGLGHSLRAQAALFPDATVAVVDNVGGIVFHAAVEGAADPAQVSAAFGQVRDQGRDGGTTATSAANGVRYLWAYRGLAAHPGPTVAWLLVGMPEDQVKLAARRQSIGTLGFGTLVLIVAITGGTVYGYLNVVRPDRSQSLTDKRDLELDIEKYVADRTRSLLRLNEDNRRMLSVVAHELRTPLTAILGFSELLTTRDKDLGAERKMWLKHMADSARQLDLLVADLLEVARLNEGRLKIEFSVIDLAELLPEISGRFEPMLRSRGQRIAVYGEKSGLPVNGDRARIFQVLGNLVSNASKYSPEETTVTVRARLAGDQVEISVTDEGAGISPEDQSRLFTPFFRVRNDETGNVPGTGLGLAICKGIMELHGGTIRVQSTPGSGSIFTMVFPRGNPGATDIGD